MRQADFCRITRGLIFRAAHTGVGAGKYLPFPVFWTDFLLHSFHITHKSPRSNQSMFAKQETTRTA
jgi:hypothetical protein